MISANAQSLHSIQSVVSFNRFFVVGRNVASDSVYICCVFYVVGYMFVVLGPAEHSILTDIVRARLIADSGTGKVQV